MNTSHVVIAVGRERTREGRAELSRTVWVTWRKKTPTRSTQTGCGGDHASRRSARRCSGTGAAADACGLARLRARAPNENGSVSPARTTTHESSGAHHVLLDSCSCSLLKHDYNVNTITT